MHHHRRKSGHGSSTDLRKSLTTSEASSSSRHSKSSSTRPAAMTRKTTPQKLGKSSRDREREWDDDRWWDEERESFPMYCMSCEKQFVAQDARFLYCSEACRVHDQTHTTVSSTPAARQYTSPPTAAYPYYTGGHTETRDIIPRASPSRPSSMHYSPPATPSQTNHGLFHNSAMSSLRSLSITDASPPSPGMTGVAGVTTGAYHHPSVWHLDTSAATATSTSTRSAVASPSNSYSRAPSTVFPSTYDTSAYYATAGAGYGMTTLDRPMPARRAGTYSRPKSIDLVTPMMGGR